MSHVKLNFISLARSVFFDTTIVPVYDVAKQMVERNISHVTNNLSIPKHLPLLEGLCWNISDCYSLDPSTMLAIYEERWNHKGVLGQPSLLEIEFISCLIDVYNGLPLLEEKNLQLDRSEVNKSLNSVLEQLDAELLKSEGAVLGGGTLISVLHGNKRLSTDLNFLIDPDSYQKLVRRIRGGESILRSFTPIDKMKGIVLKDDAEQVPLATASRLIGNPLGHILGEPRIDRYAIRYPVRVGKENPLQLKLEIVAEYSLKLGKRDFIKGKVPCLNRADKVASKLLANTDRWLDGSKFSRDLIDLAIIALFEPISEEGIDKAIAVYPDAMDCLVESIERFQRLPDYRVECYDKLQIKKPYTIINGLDKLVSLVGLNPTERGMGETDFDYLDDAKLVLA